MSATSYPRLLPRGSTNTPLPLSHEVLTQLTANLQANAACEGPHRVTADFLALCTYSINPGLASDLIELSGSQLENAALQITLGVKQWLGKRTANQTCTVDENTASQDSTSNSSSGRSNTCTAIATRRALARDRDLRSCVVTRMATVEVAHIFPVAQRRRTSQERQDDSDSICIPSFLMLLRLFAGQATAARVEEYLGLSLSQSPAVSPSSIHHTPCRSRHMSSASAPPARPALRPRTSQSNSSRRSTRSLRLIGRVEDATHSLTASQLPINRLENLITLRADVHRIWQRGIIILEPVGDPLSVFDQQHDPTSSRLLSHYDVRFAYLPAHHPLSVATGWDPRSFQTDPPLAQLQLTEATDPSVHGAWLTRLVEPSTEPGGEPNIPFLRSGTIIRLSTSDPIKYPLPHPDLLALHAALSRVVRCAGSVGYQAMDTEEDDDLTGVAAEESILGNDSVDEGGNSDAEGVVENEQEPLLPPPPPATQYLLSQLRNGLHTPPSTSPPPLNKSSSGDAKTHTVIGMKMEASSAKVRNRDSIDKDPLDDEPAQKKKKFLDPRLWHSPLRLTPFDYALEADRLSETAL